MGRDPGALTWLSTPPGSPFGVARAATRRLDRRRCARAQYLQAGAGVGYSVWSASMAERVRQDARDRRQALPPLSCNGDGAVRQRTQEDAGASAPPDDGWGGSWTGFARRRSACVPASSLGPRAGWASVATRTRLRALPPISCARIRISGRVDGVSGYAGAFDGLNNVRHHTRRLCISIS